ncbi:transcriptional coactivator/pterin dehydratase [Xylariaceae sp. FL0255]|nr:transcriptional coactivator/pterin dehydratase [Xylariaceae sp. FL0255]
MFGRIYGKPAGCYTITSVKIATRALRSPPSGARTSAPQLLLSARARYIHSSHSLSAMASGIKPSFSAGADETKLSDALQSLVGSAGNGGRWVLTPSGQGLERSFKFKNFGKTWDFMTAVSLQCKLKNHHPEWSNVYNTTYIRWTTHSPAGLSAKDVELAGLCDSLARDFGEVIEEGDSCSLREIADRVVVNAGDCCVPKKK